MGLFPSQLAVDVPGKAAGEAKSLGPVTHIEDPGGVSAAAWSGSVLACCRHLGSEPINGKIFGSLSLPLLF